jgi:hypothetical protein
MQQEILQSGAASSTVARVKQAAGAPAAFSNTSVSFGSFTTASRMAAKDSSVDVGGTPGSTG